MKTGKAQMNNHERKGFAEAERGSVLVMTALSMFALLLSTGLAIDAGRFHTAKGELQKAADASALAAASQLDSTSSGIKSAVNEATRTLNKYDFKHNVTVASSEVTFATNLNGNYVDMTTAMTNPAAVKFARVMFSPKSVNATLLDQILPHTNKISATASAGLSVGLMMNKSTNEVNRANTSHSF
jgi:uncharacterized membrane protein